MEQHFQETSSVDYSLKEGETLVLQMKNVSSCASTFPNYVYMDTLSILISIEICSSCMTET